MEVYCKKCGYTKERESIPKKCPWCDAVGSVKQAKSIQDFIEED